MLNAVLSLPKACSEFSRGGEWPALREDFGSLDATASATLAPYCCLS